MRAPSELVKLFNKVRTIVCVSGKLSVDVASISWIFPSPFLSSSCFCPCLWDFQFTLFEVSARSKYRLTVNFFCHFYLLPIPQILNFLILNKKKDILSVKFPPYFSWEIILCLTIISYLNTLNSARGIQERGFHRGCWRFLAASRIFGRTVERKKERERDREQDCNTKNSSYSGKIF